MVVVPTAGAGVPGVLLVTGVDEAGSVPGIGDVKDCFKDVAMFSNFFSRAASSRFSKALRSRPGVSEGVA